MVREREINRLYNYRRQGGIQNLDAIYYILDVVSDRVLLTLADVFRNQRRSLRTFVNPKGECQGLDWSHKILSLIFDSFTKQAAPASGVEPGQR